LLNEVTRTRNDNTAASILHVAFELAEKHWKLAFTTGTGQKPRTRQITAGDLGTVAQEIERARQRFKLPADARVVTCYEAGMDGFWLHRALVVEGYENVVVDSSSIDVKRRRRQAKTDRLDAAALVQKLVHYVAGQRRIWSVVRVPSAEAEDLRHNDREVTRLTDEATACRNMIRGLLKTQGVRLQTLRKLPEQLAEIRLWDGSPLMSELMSRLLRAWERLQLIERQIKEATDRRAELLQDPTSTTAQKARQLLLLRSLGPNMAWELSTELFGWRQFSNRRELGGLVGLVPVPYQSGESSREHGISRAGRARLRAGLIELAWLWTRYQRDSALTQWFEKKYGHGSRRLRRIGIVALARKLLVELWRYLETGALPEGALTKA
jgi:transposase